MKKCLLILVLLITACEVQPQQFVGPNGKKAYTMKCNGMGRTMEDCYKKAGEVCPKGYNIIDKSDQITGLISNAAVNNSYNSAYGTATTTVAHQSILAIECK